MAIDTVVNSIKLDDGADNGKVPVYNNTTKEFDMTTPGGGSGSPGGADTQIQYNNGGSFGGIAPLTWDDTNQVLNIDITDDEVIPISYFQGYVHNTGATEYSYFAISRDTLLFQTSGNAIFEAGAMSFQTSNELYDFYGDNGSGVFDLGAVTDDRTYTLPDASGTIALTSNIPTLGTGVATALGINVGSAGAFVTLNGALGTPSSGTLTNATGLPIAGLVASTSTALGVGSVELGHASDTTISRVSAGKIAVEGVNVGYLEIPQNSKSAAYTLVLDDGGKHIYHPSADTTARIWTIPANASVAYPIGTAITFVNDTSAGVITIAITTDTLVLAGAGTTGSRTLAANGVATAIKMTSTRRIINGTGLT